VIAAAIAAVFVYIFFAFESVATKVDVASAWIASHIGWQTDAPAQPSTVPSAAIAPEDVAPAAQPASDQRTRTTESRTPEDAISAIPGMNPDHDSQRRDAQKNSLPKADAATVPAIDTPSVAPQALALAPARAIEAKDIAAGTASQPEARAPSMQTPARPDTIPTAITATPPPSQPAASVEGMTTDSRTADQKVAVAPDLSLRSEEPRPRDVHVGAWTYCTVNLIPGGQIAVQKATTYRGCISAGKKCASNRRYADIQFFDRPTLTSKFPLEMCDAEF
jgi:hypothetical protein